MRLIRSTSALLALLFSFAFFAAACGDAAREETAEDPTDEEAADTGDTADDANAGDAAEAGDLTDTGDAGDVTDAGDEVERPQRIVSLSPTATEMLFAIGAGDQVVAADQYSNYPAEAPTTDLDGFSPNLEAILAYEPDLVVIANDANDLVAGLDAVDVPVQVSAAPATIEDGYAVIADLGVAVGRVDETAEVVAALRTEMDAAFAAAPEGAGLRVYHELDDTYYSASSNGFVGAIYAEMGVENIADEADTDGLGFPQLTEEYIVDADPQLIVITDQVSYTADDVLARSGWGEVSAVQNGSVVVVNADIASRWGPRLPQFVEQVANALNEAAVDA